jgi:alkylated DNA repair dioxygenase AlkB
MVGFQASLFDVLDWPGTTDSGTQSVTPATPILGRLDGTVRRHVLSRGAWVDVRPGWVTGSDDLFARLVRTVPWQAERRQMYERVVDVPRLLRFYGEDDALPDPVLAEVRNALSEQYRGELGEDFTTAGMCYYRDGRDSVAWHGDTIGRSKRDDTMIAIVSLGESRRLLLRPRNGVPSPPLPPHEAPGKPTLSSPVGFFLGHGDLLVMGGSCQRTWEHSIPKTAKPVGPRISVQFRPHNVR